MGSPLGFQMLLVSQKSKCSQFLVVFVYFVQSLKTSKICMTMVVCLLCSAQGLCGFHVHHGDFKSSFKKEMREIDNRSLPSARVASREAHSSGVNPRVHHWMLVPYGLLGLLLSVGQTPTQQSPVFSNQVFPNPLSVVEFIPCSQSFQLELRMGWEAPSTEG